MWTPFRIVVTAAAIVGVVVAGRIAYDEYQLWRLERIAIDFARALTADNKRNREQIGQTMRSIPDASQERARRAAAAAEREAERRKQTTVGRDLARRCAELRAVAAQLNPNSYAHEQADADCRRYDRYCRPARSRAMSLAPKYSA